MSRRRYWTCTRRNAGVACHTLNPARKQLCSACGKRRPAPRKPKHMAALNYTYEHYVELNGGEFCGICGRGPELTRRLDRDHGHDILGAPRGLLCRYDNRLLNRHWTIERLRAAADYLERAQNRTAA